MSQSKDFKFANVAFFGRPNAGKSTLLNSLMDIDFSAVSDRPQTTRKSVRGVLQLYNSEKVWNGQLAVWDTPGLNFASKGLLDRSFYSSVDEALANAHIGVWVADARTLMRDLADIEMERGGEDKVALWMMEHIKNKEGGVQWIMVLNKMDLIGKAKMLPLIQKVTEVMPDLKAVVPVCALMGKSDGQSNIENLRTCLSSLTKPGLPEFPEDMWTDVSERRLMEDLIREAIFQCSHKEVPYESECQILSFLEPPLDSGLRKEVGAVLWVSRQSLKRILVGAGGQKIKQIGTQARKRFKEITGDDVILKLFVKVVEKWDRNPRHLEDLGYATARH